MNPTTMFPDPDPSQQKLLFKLSVVPDEAHTELVSPTSTLHGVMLLEYVRRSVRLYMHPFWFGVELLHKNFSE
jgi:hypothetical protein